MSKELKEREMYVLVEDRRGEVPQESPVGSREDFILPCIPGLTYELGKI